MRSVVGTDFVKDTDMGSGLCILTSEVCASVRLRAAGSHGRDHALLGDEHATELPTLVWADDVQCGDRLQSEFGRCGCCREYRCRRHLPHKGDPRRFRQRL